MCAFGWDKLAAVGRALTTLALDIPGMWFQAVPGLGRRGSSPSRVEVEPGAMMIHLAAGEQTPLGTLLAEVCGAAPVLERLSLAAMLPGAGSNAAGSNAPAFDAGALPAPGAAPDGGGAGPDAVRCQVELPAFARLQVLRPFC